MNNDKIVVVEDDPLISKLLERVLHDEGFSVVVAETLKKGLIVCATHKPDLIILDLGLPDGDGMELLDAYRKHNSVPVIVVSARDNEKSKVEALDAGADDYLTKPFSSEEFLARVRVQLRRRLPLNSDLSDYVSFGECCYYPERRILEKNGSPLHLTKIELKLFEILFINRGKVLTQSYLLNSVWGDGYRNRTHYLRIYINRLRQKIEKNSTMPQYLLTEIGVGYRLNI